MTPHPTALDPDHPPTAPLIYLPLTMRAVVARSYGGPDALVIEDLPVPTLGADDVLVGVQATSLNALDWHLLTGPPYLVRLTGGLRRPKRTIHGVDIAGTVVAVGAAVDRWRPGDEVFGMGVGGGFGQYAAVSQATLERRPSTVDVEHAAATPVAGLTALQGLRTHGGLRTGERVLINGAAGGVGTFAVQIAVALGADVTAVCSGRNVEMVRSLGASEVIDYTSADFVEETGGFDLMLDNVGNRRAGDCKRVLRDGGRLVLVSGPKRRWLGPLPKFAATRLAFSRSGRTVTSFITKHDRDDLRDLAEWLASGDIVPAIDRVIGLDDVADGLAEIGSGHARAKIVVRPNEQAPNEQPPTEP